MEANLVSKLTEVFLSAKETDSYISLRLWFEEGDLKYFFTNQPPRNIHNKQQHDKESSAPPAAAASLPTEDKAIRTRTRKRRCPSSALQASTPENLRNSDDEPEHCEVSNLDVDRDNSLLNISCQNRFSVLNADEDLETQPQEPNHSVNVAFQLTEELDTERSNTNRSENDSTVLNRLCNYCKIVRVKEQYHVKSDCFFRHGLLC